MRCAFFFPASRQSTSHSFSLRAPLSAKRFPIEFAFLNYTTQREFTKQINHARTHGIYDSPLTTHAGSQSIQALLLATFYQKTLSVRGCAGVPWRPLHQVQSSRTHVHSERRSGKNQYHGPHCDGYPEFWSCGDEVVHTCESECGSSKVDACL